MLTDDFLASLPDDPELAFIVLVDRLDAWIAEHGSKEETYIYEAHYSDVIRAFADEYNLDAQFRRYDPNDFPNEPVWWDQFLRDVRYFKNRLQFRHKVGAHSVLATSVTLNDARRAEIHQLIGRIRKVVAVFEVPEKKRDALYARIAALAKEVDTSQTRFSTVMALILEASETAGKTIENLDPLTKLVQRITSIIADQRAETQQKQLAPPPEQKQIAPPREDLDDEIPF